MTLDVNHQRLVVYGPPNMEPTVYASLYSDSADDGKIAIGQCCKRYGAACGARIVYGEELAKKQGLTPVVRP